jgi:ADP-heptose:LPS heptosyltransferase
MRLMANEVNASKELERILVFRIGHLGDTVVALPAFRALRSAFPNAEIALLSNYDARNPQFPAARNVLPAGIFDSWITYPSGRGGLGSAVARLRLMIELRRGRFDAVFYLMTRNRTRRQIERDIRFFRWSGVSRVLCTEHLRLNTLEDPIPIPTPTVISESDFLMDSLRSEGIDRSAGPGHDLELTSEERTSATKFLSSNGAEDGVLMIGVGPGSKWESKVWPEERFADVISLLGDRYGVLPVVLGGPEDGEKGERLVSVWRKGINAAGRLSIRESAAVLEKCALYLGNDTGVMHLAGAVGTPCVAIFAAVDWIGRWYPFGDENTIFRTRVECEGCHSPTCRNNLKCLDMITVSQVFEACCVRIEQRAKTAAPVS